MDEKIFEILSQMQSQLSNIEGKLQHLESDVRSIKLYQENVLDDNIKLLAENMSSANESLN